MVLCGCNVIIELIEQVEGECNCYNSTALEDYNTQRKATGAWQSHGYYPVLDFRASCQSVTVTRVGGAAVGSLHVVHASVRGKRHGDHTGRDHAAAVHAGI